MVEEINKETVLNTLIFDPSPHRFTKEQTPVSERQIPLVFSCDNCAHEISFKTKSFEKHCNSVFSNLNPEEDLLLRKYISENELEKESFLDFHCPNCGQATRFIYECGPTGYWGAFGFKIKHVLVIRK